MTNDKITAASAAPELQHTAGPWKYDVYGRKTGDTRFFIETTDNKHGIAAIRPTDTASSLLPIEEHEANARLIAAAPDLLEALIEAEKYSLKDISINPSIFKVRAAINKATQKE